LIRVKPLARPRDFGLREGGAAGHGLITSLTLFNLSSSEFTGTKTLWGGFKFVIKDPRHALLRAFDNELETCLFWLGLLVFAP
jgi:hypothetical protein